MPQASHNSLVPNNPAPQLVRSRLSINSPRRFAILLGLTLAVVAAGVATAGFAKATRKARKPKAEVALKTEPRYRRAGSREFWERKALNSRRSGSALLDRINDALLLSQKPQELRLQKAHEFKGDLRELPQTPPVKRERPEREAPEREPRIAPGTIEASLTTSTPAETNAPAAPAPTPLITFDGLDFATWGAGHPPDTNGDVGPTYYIQTVNTSIGIYNKSTGAQTAAFTFDTFMSQGNFGNLCDTDNFGDPVVVYDSFEDRWIISDFAFQLNGAGDVVNPPGSFQCFAASKTGDPVTGGWNFYSLNTAGGLGDYPKFGIWPDGLYMTVNMFGYLATDSYIGPRVYALNKAQMYAGAPSVQVVTFDGPVDDFTILPANARLQTGTPPAGTPNFFASTSVFLNALSIYKFHVDWNSISLSTFTGPDVPIAATSWPNASVANAPSLGGNSLDTLALRAMMQNQYTNLGGVESLWDTHTVRRADVNGAAAPRWYQIVVTGGNVNGAIPQAVTWDPDGNNNMHRFMPSLAVDRSGNLALGYSTSSSTTKPALKYAGRLAADPVNTFSLTEQLLFQGAGTQTGNCGGAPCTRWGDYSAMTLDPDGCTFWYTNEYYAVDGLNDLTRIGKFTFPGCNPVGAGGTVSGTVTRQSDGTPISGASVALGSRTTTTGGAGTYSFTGIPAGTYPSITGSNPGFNASTSSPVLVTDGGTTTKNFALTAAPASACLVDTTQSDFLTGVPANVDLNISPGDAKLTRPNTLDQQNLTVTSNGFGFTNTVWAGHTFTPALTGELRRVDLNLFCSGCTGTTPNLTVSIRATTPSVPTGADLATTTIPGFNSGAGGFFSANFATPATVTAGTRYAVIIRASAAPSAGTYAYVCSCSGGGAANSNPYANGQRVTSSDSGGSWTADPVIGGRDLGFITFVSTGFAASGDQTSSLKDANPSALATYPHWASLAWSANVPANTAVKFQVAGSNNQYGPFNFVGPDGTVATFYNTSPANITALNGNRYLKYKAFLTTTNGAVSPTLNDVTACFNNTAAPTAAPATISGRVTLADGNPLPGVTINLNGGRSAKVITDSQGNYRFDNVDTDSFYTVTPALLNYHFGPESSSFSLLGNKTDAVFTATPDAVSSGNVIDSPDYFVRQHYLDFLGREPDESGFNFWSDQILSCGSDAVCRERHTINVSAAYFLSIEFQQTGVLVDGLYRASFDRRPTYAEFFPDTALVARNVIVGQGDWAETLAANKQAFLAAWVERPQFRSAYDSLSNSQYVDTLLGHAAGFNGVREALIDGLNSGALTRVAALRQIVENEGVISAKRNATFVMMQYFGYLRRDPDEAGYQFWLRKLNDFGGNFEQAEMVKAFLVSSEYRARFAQ
jgi:hypothetical protein